MPIPISPRGPGALVAMLAFMVVTFVASSAWPTIMKYADLAALVEISDAIVRAEVVDQRSYLSDGDPRRETTFRVTRVFHGDVGSKLHVVQWGGNFPDGRRFAIPGDAKFDQGEDVVLFLHGREVRGGKDSWALSLLGQSKFLVQSRPGRDLVVRDMKDISLLVSAEGSPTKIAHYDDEMHSYAGFVAELEALVAGIKRGQQ